MKAYVCSIKERTTQICCDQLARFGFEVVLMDEVEPWLQKYQRFISLAYSADKKQDCIRVDADVIVNKNVEKILHCTPSWLLMIQYLAYDFYRNNVGISSPIFYSNEAIDIIYRDFDKLGEKNRPEASAWRLPEINPLTYTSDQIMGIHGFFQDRSAFARALKNKRERKQMAEYDFELANRLLNL